MIIEWKIKCDQCDKIINGVKDTFLQNENGEWCNDCEEKYGAMC